MVKPLDQLLRGRVAPLLARRGFVRHGRVFEASPSGGDKAIVEFRPWSIGKHDIEALVDCRVQPEVWSAWARARNPNDPGNGGMLEWRVADPGRPLPAGNCWEFDIDDEPSIDRLLKTLDRAIDRAMTLCDRGAFIDLLRKGEVPRLGDHIMRRDVALALLLSDEGRSEELAALVTVLKSDDIDPGIIGFIERRAAEAVR